MEHFSDALLVKKINKIISVLEEKTISDLQKIETVTYTESGYTKDNLPPEGAEWKQMEDNTEFVCHDRHYWIHFSLKTPELSPEEAVYLSFQTGREGQWDAVNPQMLLFLNGEIVQGGGHQPHRSEGCPQHRL
jgi:alpha-mannosidase